MVHVLLYGASLCEMPGVPKDWPRGHRWCRLDESAHATCGVCTAKARKLLSEQLDAVPGGGE